jgi:hypothetical protein
MTLESIGNCLELRMPSTTELSACPMVTVLTNHALQQLNGAQKAEATHHTALSISV